MPYVVSKRGEKWVVKKKGGSKVFGTHDSKEAAREQQRALYAAESVDPMIAAVAGMITDDPDLFSEEEKWIQGAVHPERKGMFKGRSKASLEKEKSALKKKNAERKKRGEKVPEKDRTRMSQLNFAIRAKSKGGLV